MTEIVHYGLSFQGKRSNNEDAILQLHIDEETCCFAVADGMGGAEAGEIASRETLRFLSIALKAAWLARHNDNPDLKAILKKAITETQQKISKLIESNSGLTGMGTTLTVLLIHKGSAVWANIGDSRIYLTDDEHIRQITIDHTYIEQYRQEHHTEVPESIAARYGNIITRSIGGETDEADYFPADEADLKLEEGMFFLLCSDGLITSKIADTGSELLPYMLHYKEPQKIIEQLISKAFHDGSTDNISAIIVCYGKKPRRKTKGLPVYTYPPKVDKDTRSRSFSNSKTSSSKPLRLLRKPMHLFALLLIITLLVVAYFYVKEVYYTEYPEQTERAMTEKPPEKPLGDTPLKKKDEKIRIPTSDTSGSKNVLYTQQQLQEIREKSLMGISKLLVTFVKDTRVKNKIKPLDYLKKTLEESEKPDFIGELHYYEPEFDSAGKVVDSAEWKELIAAITSADKLPKFIMNKKNERYLLNRADSARYVIMEVKDLSKVEKGDYDTDPVSFAHESGLKSLSMLLSEIYGSYFHGENVKRDLSPLLQYLVRYKTGEPQDTFGKSITEGFEHKAASTKDFYIQSLKLEDGKNCIDICVPVKNKKNSGVIRLGYRID